MNIAPPSKGTGYLPVLIRCCLESRHSIRLRPSVLMRPGRCCQWCKGEQIEKQTVKVMSLVVVKQDAGCDKVTSREMLSHHSQLVQSLHESL